MPERRAGVAERFRVDPALDSRQLLESALGAYRIYGQMIGARSNPALYAIA